MKIKHTSNICTVTIELSDLRLINGVEKRAMMFFDVDIIPEISDVDKSDALSFAGQSRNIFELTKDNYMIVGGETGYMIMTENEKRFEEILKYLLTEEIVIPIKTCNKTEKQKIDRLSFPPYEFPTKLNGILRVLMENICKYLDIINEV